MNEELTYRLWVSEDRCTRMELWSNGAALVALRSHPSEVWGPPIVLTEEEVATYGAAKV